MNRLFIHGVGLGSTPSRKHKKPYRYFAARWTGVAQGFSLVEAMVSIVIGMIVVLVLMQLAATAEQWNRNATTGGDAQTHGQLAAYIISRDITEAGGSLVSARCHNDPASPSASDLVLVQNGTLTSDLFLPHLPVVITSNGTTGDRIQFMAQSSVAGGGSLALWNRVNALDTTSFLVRSFQGLETGGFMLVSRDTDSVNTFTFGGGDYDCLMTPIGNIAAAAAPDEGLYQVNHAAVPFIVGDDIAGSASKHWIQGVGRLQPQQLYVVDKTASGGQASLMRRTFALGTDPTDSGNTTLTETAEAADVVYLKAFYGFDNQETPTGQVTTWRAANACSIDAVQERWACTGILNDANARTAERLLAIRFGLVIKVAQHDKDYANNPDVPPPDHVNLWTWSDVCTTPCTAPAPDAVVYAIPTAPDDLRDYRYRVFQAVVPLRSSIWNIN